MFRFKTSLIRSKTFRLSVRILPYILFIEMTLLSSLVFSQIGGALPPPPVQSQIDSRGIDMLSGTPSLPGMYVSIGTDGSGLVRDPGRDLAERDNFTGTLTSINISNSVNVMNLPVGSYIRVSAGLDTEVFRADTYENYDKTGGQLSCASTLCTYINRNGDVTEFDKTKTNGFSQGISEGGDVKRLSAKHRTANKNHKS